MNQEEYFKDRLLDQIDWYGKKAGINKKYYLAFKVAQIVISVFIPFLTGYVDQHASIKFVIGAFGVALAILAGISSIYKFQEKWIEYRNTNEMLKHEKYMFLTKSGAYKTDASLANLAERVELLITNENTNWNQQMNRKDEGAGAPAKTTEEEGAV